MFINDIRVCPGSSNDKQVWNFIEARRHVESLRANQYITEQEGMNHYLIDNIDFLLIIGFFFNNIFT